jgi:hypothetical protein
MTAPARQKTPQGTDSIVNNNEKKHQTNPAVTVHAITAGG